jgi:hypothetical protein
MKINLTFQEPRTVDEILDVLDHFCETDESFKARYFSRNFMNRVFYRTGETAIKTAQDQKDPRTIVLSGGNEYINSPLHAKLRAQKENPDAKHHELLRAAQIHVVDNHRVIDTCSVFGEMIGISIDICKEHMRGRDIEL